MRGGTVRFPRGNTHWLFVVLSTHGPNCSSGKLLARGELRTLDGKRLASSATTKTKTGTAKAAALAAAAVVAPPLGGGVRFMALGWEFSTRHRPDHSFRSLACWSH